MKSNKTFIAAVILTISLFALWGCPKKAEVASVAEAQESTRTRAEAEATAKAKEQESAARAKDTEAKERAATSAAGLQPVYFDFDQSQIRRDARAVMKANAEWLKANPKVQVQIEGNCDERGPIEYNQALGQRRAQSAKKYLADIGIAGKRISIISYGEEKPACKGRTEECWQKNRRADLVSVSE